MNNAFLLMLAAVLVSADLPAQPSGALFSSDSSLVIVPFRDRSGFSGRWNIAMDVPRFLTAYVKERFRAGVIGPQSVAAFAAENGIDSARMHDGFFLRSAAEEFRTRYILDATVDEFSVSRFMVSEVQLAGYEAFSATVKLTYTIYDAARFGMTGAPPVVYEGEAEGTVKDRALGLTLFGKRTDRMTQFFSLDELAFGSEQFNRTILGEAMFQCADELSKRLERAVPELVSRTVVLSGAVVIDSTDADSTAIVLKRRFVTGEVVIVDGDEVFLNVGTLDSVGPGDVLTVYIPGKELRDPATGELLGTADEKVGEVQIVQVRAERLSLAAILDGKGKIAPKQKVRKVIVR